MAIGVTIAGAYTPAKSNCASMPAEASAIIALHARAHTAEVPAMRSPLLIALLATIVASVSITCADDSPDAVAVQKKQAEANWSQLDIGDYAHAETPHLLFYAPKNYAGRMKETGTQLEKAYGTAVKALQFKPNDEPWPGKLTVYLLADRDSFASFVRRIVKRRVDADETGAYRVDEDPPLVGAAPPRAMTDPRIEVQAAQQIAEALLARKAGKTAEAPEWLLTGFGRATAVRAGLRPPDTPNAAKLAVAGRKAADVWGGNVPADEAGILRGSLVDYLAYGGGASRFPAFVAAFQPGENMTSVTTDQAFKAANIDPERVERGWRESLRKR